MESKNEMKRELLNLLEEKSPGSKPLFLVIRDSHAYGTNIETSDVDFSGIFIQKLDDILGNKYIEQVNDDSNDIVLYELRRFLDLLKVNNPTILELLNTPDDCIIYKDPIFDIILNQKDKFITKICADSFGGYARQQVNKAKGQNKKQNWKKDRVIRKTITDFCYVIEGNKSIKLDKWLIDNKYPLVLERYFGVVNIPNAKDMYSLYFNRNLNYKGLLKAGGFENMGVSNQLRLSSIPVGELPIANFIYNKDGYSQHCKDFSSYQEWLKKSNESRWVDVKNHGQKIDGKNMMHCVRLIEMAKEIAEGKGIVVRRENHKELISIRKGEVDLQTLIDKVELEINDVYRLFKKSNLPDSIDENLINKLNVKIRKRFYFKRNFIRRIISYVLN